MDKIGKDHVAITVSGATFILLIITNVLGFSSGYTTHRETDMDMSTMNQRFDQVDKTLDNIYGKLDQYSQKENNDYTGLQGEYSDLEDEYTDLHYHVDSLLDDRARKSLNDAEQLQIKNSYKAVHHHNSVPQP